MSASSAADFKSSYPKQNPVIFGGGPGGLITAILLLQKGVKKITIVDPRVGKYPRGGVYSISVFEEISRAIGFPVRPGPLQSISELETQLYEYLKKQPGVNFISAKFHDIKDNNTVSIDDGLGIRDVPCDLLFDCTGVSKVVTKAVNKKLDKPHFNFIPIGNNPHKDYVYVRAKMDDKEGDRLLNAEYELQSLTSKQYLDDFFILREQGWNHYSFPEFIFGGTKAGEGPIYVETPPKCDTAEKQLKWVNTLINLKTNNSMDAIQVAEHEIGGTKRKKLQLSRFQVCPSYTLPAYFEGNHKVPTMVPLTDASMNLPQNTNSGLIFGAYRVKKLMENIRVNSRGEIEAIDFNTYAKEYHTAIRDGINLTEESYQKTRTRLGEGGIILLQAMLELYNDYQNQLINISDPVKGFAIHKFNVQIAIRNVMNTLMMMHAFLPAKAPMRDALVGLLLEFAARCKQLAKYLFKRQNYSLADKYFRIAVQLYLKYAGEAAHEKIIILFSNLIITANKLNNHDSAIKLADQVLRRMGTPEPSIAKFYIKIQYNKAWALFNKVKDYYLFNDRMDDRHFILLNDALLILKHLQTENRLEERAIEALIDKVNKLSKNKKGLSIYEVSPHLFSPSPLSSSSLSASSSSPDASPLPTGSPAPGDSPPPP